MDDEDTGDSWQDLDLRADESWAMTLTIEGTRLHIADAAVIACYFALVLVVGLWVSGKGSTLQTAKALGSTSVRHRSDTKMSDRCLIDVDLRVFVIWESGLTTMTIAHGANVGFTLCLTSPMSLVILKEGFMVQDLRLGTPGSRSVPFGTRILLCWVVRQH